MLSKDILEGAEDKVESVEEIGRIYKVKLKGIIKEPLYVKTIKDGDMVECYMSSWIGTKPAASWYGYIDKKDSFEESLGGVLRQGLSSYWPDAKEEDVMIHKNEHYNDF